MRQYDSPDSLSCFVDSTFERYHICFVHALRRLATQAAEFNTKKSESLLNALHSNKLLHLNNLLQDSAIISCDQAIKWLHISMP